MILCPKPPAFEEPETSPSSEQEGETSPSSEQEGETSPASEEEDETSPASEEEDETSPASEQEDETSPASDSDSSDCGASPLPDGLVFGAYSDNPQCVQGGTSQLGFEYGWKMTGCIEGTFTLDKPASGDSEIKGSCGMASSIKVTVSCNNDKSADIHWSGEGNSKVVLKVKGGNGGNPLQHCGSERRKLHCRQKEYEERREYSGHQPHS